MTITLLSQRIMEEMKLRIHMQTAQIKDEELKFHSRPEADEQPALNRAVYEAIVRMVKVFGRYMAPETATTEASALSLPTNFSFDLHISPRRLGSNSEAMANAMFSFVVDNAIHAYYIANAASELAKIQVSAVETDKVALEDLIFKKRNPIYEINQ